MCGVCAYRGCEALGFLLIKIGKRLEWWACRTHQQALWDDAEWTARPWEAVRGTYPSALVMEDLQAWRTWKRLATLAYDELRQIGA